jgi:hypothetical protein
MQLRSPLALAALALASPALAGTVKGAVRLTGAAPALAPLTITRDQTSCGAAVPDESVVASNGRLANVVVVVRGAPAPPAAKALVLDQQRCRFLPHVQAAPRGSSLEILNSDPVLHNSHGYLGQATAFNVALPLKGQRVARKLDKVGPMKVKCDVHPWMSAFVVVTDGPAAVSGSDGTFAVAGVPAGSYTVTAWHERFGERTAQVTVPASGEATVDFTFGG